MKLLHINSSSRGDGSQSLNIAEFFIDQLGKKQPLEIDRYNLFEDDLPAFGKVAVGAKMALFTGAEANSEQKQVWTKIKEVFDRFAAADIYVINVPLWNNGIPYVLKQFIDVVTQPGWTFGFDMEKGYSGLLKNKKAVVVHASGVYYDGIAPAFGSDFCTPYINDWLKFIGVDVVEQIHVAPTVVTSDFDSTRNEAERRAIGLVETLA
jgi:FMN-dependent NADH-azoreductase